MEITRSALGDRSKVLDSLGLFDPCHEIFDTHPAESPPRADGIQDSDLATDGTKIACRLTRCHSELADELVIETRVVDQWTFEIVNIGGDRRRVSDSAKVRASEARAELMSSS
jgi:hypothetical protein